MKNRANARIARLSPAAKIRHYESMERFYLNGNNTEAAARMANAAHFTALKAGIAR